MLDADYVFKEMFKRVGLFYPNHIYDQCDDWYRKWSWSLQEENSFAEWLTKHIKEKHTRTSNKYVRDSVNMFLLQYGWVIKT